MIAIGLELLREVPECSITFNTLCKYRTGTLKNEFRLRHATKVLKALFLDSSLPQKQMIAQPSALFCQLYCY